MKPAVETIRLNPDDIRRDAEIHPRYFQIDPDTLRNYTTALRNGAKFETRPLLWRNEVNPDAAPMAIDGWHQIKAFGEAFPGKKITCNVFTGPRLSAMRRSVGANARHGLPLSGPERADYAWKMVREVAPEGEAHAFTKETVAKLTGVSRGTVDNMRARWAVIKADPLRHASGQWARDRKDEWQPPSDEETQERFRAVADIFRQAVLDTRRGMRDCEFLDAVSHGLGINLTRAFIERHADTETLALLAAERQEELAEQSCYAQETPCYAPEDVPF